MDELFERDRGYEDEFNVGIQYPLPSGLDDRDQWRQDMGDALGQAETSQEKWTVQSV